MFFCWAQHVLHLLKMHFSLRFIHTQLNPCVGGHAACRCPVWGSLPEIEVDLPNDVKQPFAKHSMNGISLWTWLADATCASDLTEALCLSKLSPGTYLLPKAEVLQRGMLCCLSVNWLAGGSWAFHPVGYSCVVEHVILYPCTCQRTVPWLPCCWC